MTAAAHPDELSALKALVDAQRVEIARLQRLLAKLRRQPFGRRSEPMTGLLDQLELQLEELETGDAEVTAVLESRATPRRPRPPASSGITSLGRPTSTHRTRPPVRTAAAR